MKTLLRLFIYGMILLVGLTLALILLPVILLLLVFMVLRPGRRAKIHTFRFGSRPSPFRPQGEPERDFSRDSGSGDIIDVEAREVGTQRKTLDTASRDEFR